MTVQGMMQQLQSSPHQQGSLTPGVTRLIGAEDVDVAEEEEEEVVVRDVEVEGLLRGIWWGIVACVWAGWVCVEGGRGGSLRKGGFGLGVGVGGSWFA